MNQPKHTEPEATVKYQCIFQYMFFPGQHSHITNKAPAKISASCEVAVSNIDTRKAAKNPKKATVNNIEFKYMELIAANTQNTNVPPLYGSVVNALDNNIGMCSSHVCLDTSTNAIKEPIIKRVHDINQYVLKLKCKLYGSFVINI